MEASNRVTFNGNGEEASKKLQKSPVVNRPSEEEKIKKKNSKITCKYDRQQMRRRLEIEEWMDDQLRELYKCEEDEDYPIEIDIDELLEEGDELERRGVVLDLLKDATLPKDTFVTDLLRRIQTLRKPTVAPTRKVMEMSL